MSRTSPKLSTYELKNDNGSPFLLRSTSLTSFLFATENLALLFVNTCRYRNAGVVSLNSHRQWELLL